jgi:hypothetical protein
MLDRQQTPPSGSSLLMLRALGLLNGLEFDSLTLFEDGLTGPEVDVLRGQIVQALMVPPCVVIMEDAKRPIYALIT